MVLFHLGRDSPQKKAVSVLGHLRECSHVSPDQEQSRWKSHPGGQHLPPILQLLQNHVGLTVRGHAEGWKHCMGLQSQQEHGHLSSLRSSASVSHWEPGGRKWEGWRHSESLASLSTNDPGKSNGHYLASQGAVQPPKISDSKATAEVAGEHSPLKAAGLQSLLTEGSEILKSQHPASAPRLAECLQCLLLAHNKSIRGFSECSACCEPPL